MKLFPDKWYKKMSRSELKEAREQLRAYSISKELDTGISEVSASVELSRMSTMLK